MTSPLRAPVSDTTTPGWSPTCKSSGSFPWAQVGPEAIERVAADAGLRLAHLGDHHGRWFAVLAR